MPLIQVTSGGQRSLLKKKLQVCESQQSCLFVGDQILIFHHNLQINSLKILQCDFWICFSYFVSHSWGIPMMKITGLSHLFKWENLHNWWLTKYLFAPLYQQLGFSIKESCWRSNPKSPGLLFWVFYTLEESSSQQTRGTILGAQRQHHWPQSTGNFSTPHTQNSLLPTRFRGRGKGNVSPWKYQKRWLTRTALSYRV